MTTTLGHLPLRQVLEGLSKPEFQAITEKTRVQEAFDLMMQQGVTILPLVGSSSGACIGFLRLFDLANHLVTFIMKEGMGRTEEDIEEAIAAHKAAPVSECIDLSKEKAKFSILAADDPFIKALETFTGKIQRILVVDEGEPVGFLTPKDILSFLSKQDLPELDQSIQKLGAFKGPSKVMVLYDDKPAMTAYALMTIHGVRAIPIVNMSGKIQGTIGFDELYSLRVNQFKQFILPVLDFLKFVNPEGSKEKQKGNTKETRAREVVSRLASSENQVEWILDEKGKPISSISCYDLMSALIPLL